MREEENLRYFLHRFIRQGGLANVHDHGLAVVVVRRAVCVRIVYLALLRPIIDEAIEVPLRVFVLLALLVAAGISARAFSFVVKET